MVATQSNCGKPLKPLIPPSDGNILSGTRGKLRKTAQPTARKRRRLGLGHGKNSKDESER